MQFRTEHRIGGAWRRGFGLCRRLGIGQSYYRLTQRLLIGCYASSIIQRLLFADCTEIIKSFLASLGASSSRTKIAISLAERTLRRWEYHEPLSRLKPDQLASLMEFDNAHFFTEALERGRGVLCVHNHAGPVRLFVIYCAQQGRPVLTVADRTLAVPLDADDGHRSMLTMARDLVEARRVLNRAGIISILPDGIAGARFHSLPFAGKIRDFRTGFAELACLTEATVLPVQVTSEPCGGTRVVFYEPLCVEGGVVDLVRQYRAHLEAMWRHRPEAVHYKHMLRYLSNTDIYRLKSSQAVGADVRSK